MNKKIFWWAATIMIMLAIFYFSNQDGGRSSSMSEGIMERFFSSFLEDASASQQEMLHTLIRKMGHFSIYFALGIAVINLIRCYRNDKAFIFSTLICLAYAISDEIHQSFIAERSPAVTDVLIDLVGSLAAISLTLLLIHLIKQRKQKQQLHQVK